MEPSRFTRTRRRATLASLISALALLSPSTLTRSRTAHSLCGLPAPRGAGPHLRRTQMMKILEESSGKPADPGGGPCFPWRRFVAGARRQNARRGAPARRDQLRREHGDRRLLDRRQQGRMGGVDHGFLPRRRRRGAGRRGQSEIRSVDAAAALRAQRSGNTIFWQRSPPGP